ncbi:MULTISPECIES: hypothetical protein [Rhizobium]|uniref:hypothetical protein n=1 Tax=Rhizobium TaxID=379 RepID=UPI000FEC6DA4|nr:MULTISPECIES: hypothetical protein [Rhizobium]MBY3138994.1 hypothetical protein [Rhizobium laguerreae]RWX36696.1 hypothetical protein EHI43_08795 [Rhizobium leguminosarum]
MKSFLIFAAALAIPSLAHADDSVKHANAMCRAMENTDIPMICNVSGSGHTVTMTINMISSEARTFCQGAASQMRQVGASFEPGWTLRIVSPTSGSSVAECSL